MKLKVTVLVVCFACCLATAQIKLQTLEGIDASSDPVSVLRVDPNGAIGTKQYMEWVDQAYQGFDKVTGAPVYSKAQLGTVPFVQNNVSACEANGGNGVVLFDHLAQRWVMGIRMGGPTNYVYCVAVSTSDDLATTKWYAFDLSLIPILTVNGKTYYPDYPKIATWPDAYYVTLDLEDPSHGFQEVGVVVCAFDRQNMLNGIMPNQPQCFRYPQTPNELFLGHSMLPADIDGTTPPPAGTVESFISIQNPSGSNTTSTQLNLWQMHVDWTNPANTTFTGPTAITVSAYQPGCYTVKFPTNTYCVPEPTSPTSKDRIDSVGDRLMHRFAFRQFPNYQSYLITHTVQPSATSQQTGIRWYELEPSGNTMTVANSGTISPDNKYFRFVPSVAQDNAGNMAIGYSGSSLALHPSIAVSYLNLPSNSKPTEFGILMGSADVENTEFWGGYTSMTVDPVDDCTFWYVNEYLTTNQTGSTRTWRTRLAHFQLRGCQ